MWKDPIIDQIHQIREEWAAKFNYDTKALLENIEQQKQQDYLTDEDGNFIKDEKGGLILKSKSKLKKSKNVTCLILRLQKYNASLLSIPVPP